MHRQYPLCSLSKPNFFTAFEATTFDKQIGVLQWWEGPKQLNMNNTTSLGLDNSLTKTKLVKGKGVRISRTNLLT